MRSLTLILLFVACGRDPEELDAGLARTDAGAGAGFDGGSLHSELDASVPTPDAAVDAGPWDAGVVVDAGAFDGGTDAGTTDAGADAGTPDAGRPDAGPTLRSPPPLPTYAGTCPALVSSPTASLARNTNFRSGGDAREFLLLVPPNYTPTKRYPVVFGFHWLNASANSVVRDAKLESAVAQFEFIAVVPENLDTSLGKAYQFDWPFVEGGAFAAKELGFFDDMLACVSQQFSVDPARVHVFGASAGGLWAAYLSTTTTVNRVASVFTISGGLGEETLSGLWRTDFVPQPNKFPALVVWGGPLDFLILNFELASKRYRDALRADGHFVAQCVHAGGHGIPPFAAPTDGGTRFPMFWEFFRDHPYGLPPNTSPYQSQGLPPSFPSVCSISP